MITGGRWGAEQALREELPQDWLDHFLSSLLSAIRCLAKACRATRNFGSSEDPLLSYQSLCLNNIPEPSNRIDRLVPRRSCSFRCTACRSSGSASRTGYGLCEEVSTRRVQPREGLRVEQLRVGSVANSGSACTQAHLAPDRNPPRKKRTRRHCP